MPSSDSSTAYPAACGFSPSRLRLSSTIGDEAPSRSPGSRARDTCERAELFSDLGGKDGSRSTFLGSASWPSAGVNGVGSSRLLLFRGSITRPAQPSSYASPRVSPREAQGWDFPGVDSSWGRICLIRRCLLFLLTYILLPVYAGALTPDTN